MLDKKLYAVKVHMQLNCKRKCHKICNKYRPSTLKTVKNNDSTAIKSGRYKYQSGLTASHYI